MVQAQNDFGPMDLDPDVAEPRIHDPNRLIPAFSDPNSETPEQTAARQALFQDTLSVRDLARVKVLENKFAQHPGDIPHEVLISSILACDGNLTQSAHLLGVSYARLAMFVDKDPRLVLACSQARQQIVDMAEEVLKDHLRASNLKAATFTLSTLGKDRGYVPRTDQHREVNTKVTVSSIDLSKLTTDQLRELRSMRDSVTVIDGESEEVTDEVEGEGK